MIEYDSPVDEAFESAPLFRTALAKVLRGEEVDPDLFHQLMREYTKQICGGEYWHKSTTETLFGPRLAKMGPVTRTYITQARCPVTKMIITGRHEIGIDIPEPEYLDVIESPDLQMAEEYPPTCEPCSTAKREPEEHPTIIGFTRYLAGSKRDIFKALYDARQAYHNMEGLHEYGGMHGIPEIEDDIGTLHAECADRLDDAELGFRREVFTAPDDLFVEMRIKGHVRFREKLKRTIAAAYGGKEIGQVSDVYGTRFIAQTHGAVEEIITGLRNEIIQLHGASTLIAAPAEQRFKSDKYIWEVNKDTHHSLRLTVRFGPEHLRSRLSLHGMSLDDWFLDQVTHATYEEKQRATLLARAATTPEVQRACNVIDDIFDRLDRSGR